MTHTEIEITAELVRDLLRDQHPDLADRPVRLGARGWDNQLWRLGDDLAVRLPWATQSADALLRKEYTWVPSLAPRLPLQVPVPQRLGEPSERFPRPWIVTTWVPGAPADRAPATSAAEAADTLATFLTALHRPAPDAAPVGGYGRGGRWPSVPSRSPSSSLRPPSWGWSPIRMPSARSGKTPSPHPPGRARHCGSTATCIRPTSSPRRAPSAA